MKFNRFLLVFSMLIILNFTEIQAQTNIGIRIITLNSHFGNDSNTELYTRNLVAGGVLTFEPGILLSLETHVETKTSFQFSSAMLWDQVDNLSGYSQAMLKYQFYKSWKTTISAGFGPAIHYRKNRTGISEYTDEGVFTDNGVWQTKVSWISGEISLQYFVTKRTDVILSVNHTQARAVGLSAGFKFWFGDKPRRTKEKGCNCPSFR